MPYIRNVLIKPQTRFTWCPTRTFDRDLEFVFPTWSVVNIAEDCKPLVQLHVKRVVAFNWMHKSINNRLVWIFVFACSPKSIPNYQETTIILINVLFIAGLKYHKHCKIKIEMRKAIILFLVICLPWWTRWWLGQLNMSSKGPNLPMTSVCSHVMYNSPSCKCAKNICGGTPSKAIGT